MDLWMLIVLISLLMVPSDCEEVKKLTGSEGGSITLPDPVLETGFLQFERKILAGIDERKTRIYEKTFKDRVLWNSNTGLFTITGLQRSDSGIYTIDSKRNESSLTTSYKLSVYESVSTPAVERFNGSAESCSLLCFFNKTEETTLSWLKGEELVNQSSSALSLLLTIDEQDYSSSYRCVAASPAEAQTLSVEVALFCSAQKGTPERHYYAIIIPIVSTVGVILFAVIFGLIIRGKKKTLTHTQVQEEPDVEYTAIQLVGNRNSQGGVFPGSPAAVPDSLTTVYSKLEAHHMLPISTPNPVYEQTAYIH